MRGTWVAQSVKRPTLDFSSSHDLRILGLSPAAGSRWSLLKILSLSPSPPSFHVHSLSNK